MTDFQALQALSLMRNRYIKRLHPLA